MKILVTHIANTFNYGSAMMAINLMYYLNTALGSDVEFYTDTRGEMNLLRLRVSTGLNNIHINNVRPKIVRRYKFKTLTLFNNVNFNIRWINQYAKGVIDNYDAVIVCGGDDLSEYYNKLKVVFETYKIGKISHQIPVFLVSQTIGPFTKWRKKLVRKHLKECYIYTRDVWSLKYLKNTLGLNKLFDAADLAFLDLPNQLIEDETASILDRYQLTQDEYITLVPSGLVRSYTSNREHYILTWRDILLNLMNEQRLKDKKIVLLGHVVRSFTADDRVVINEILNQLDTDYKKRIVPIYDTLLPYQARLILGSGVFAITGRMHAAISTFQMGKPAISLSYSIKYQGVIEETLGIKNLVVKTAHENQWDLGIICDEVNLRVDYVLNNYLKIKIEINEAVKKCKEKALIQINHIARVLKDGE